MAKIGLMAFRNGAPTHFAFKCTGTVTDASGKSWFEETTTVIDRNAGLVSGAFGQTSITSEAPKPGYGFQLGTINENFDIEEYLRRDLRPTHTDQWSGRVTTFTSPVKTGQSSTPK